MTRRSTLRLSVRRVRGTIAPLPPHRTTADQLRPFVELRNEAGHVVGTTMEAVGPEPRWDRTMQRECFTVEGRTTEQLTVVLLDYNCVLGTGVLEGAWAPPLDGPREVEVYVTMRGNEHRYVVLILELLALRAQGSAPFATAAALCATTAAAVAPASNADARRRRRAPGATRISPRRAALEPFRRVAAAEGISERCAYVDVTLTFDGDAQRHHFSRAAARGGAPRGGAASAECVGRPPGSAAELRAFARPHRAALAASLGVGLRDVVLRRASALVYSVRSSSELFWCVGAGRSGARCAFDLAFRVTRRAAEGDDDGSGGGGEETPPPLLLLEGADIARRVRALCLGTNWRGVRSRWLAVHAEGPSRPCNAQLALAFVEPLPHGNSNGSHRLQSEALAKLEKLRNTVAATLGLPAARLAAAVRDDAEGSATLTIGAPDRAAPSDPSVRSVARWVVELLRDHPVVALLGPPKWGALIATTTVAVRSNNNTMTTLSAAWGVGGYGTRTLAIDSAASVAVIAELGRGSFGRVARSRHVASGRSVILITAETATEATHLRRHLMHLRAAAHPTVVSCWGAFRATPGEEIEGGECMALEDVPTLLRSRLRAVGAFSERAAQFCAAQLLGALAHMHDRGLIYRGLCLDSLVIDDAGYVRVSDFHYVKHVEWRDAYAGRTATLIDAHAAYTAPEVLRGEGHSGKLDLWTLGILVYELIVGEHPFASAETRREAAEHAMRCRQLALHGIDAAVLAPDVCATFCKILDVPREQGTGTGGLGLPETSYASVAAHAAVRSMLRLDPAQRPTARECQAHEWFGAGPTGGTADTAEWWAQLTGHSLAAPSELLPPVSRSRSGTLGGERGVGAGGTICLEREEEDGTPLEPLDGGEAGGGAYAYAGDDETVEEEPEEEEEEEDEMSDSVDECDDGEKQHAFSPSSAEEVWL